MECLAPSDSILLAQVCNPSTLLSRAPSSFTRPSRPSHPPSCLHPRATQACKSLRAVHAAHTARGASPPPLAHAAGTHEGGKGGLGKENQDTFFVIHPSADLAVYAVFDGHGKRFGSLASRVAAKRVAWLLGGWHKWVLQCPEEAMKLAFESAHHAVRAAMLAADPGLRAVRGRDAGGEGEFVLQWVVDEGDAEEQGYWDAADGGTTASVVMLLRGESAVVGVVGDSSVVLLGRQPHARAFPTHRLLVEEHSPPCLSEYVRIHALPTGPQVRFVYDCPDFEEFAIFEHDEATGAARLSKTGLASADAHECMRKNSREDRFTLLAIPECELDLPSIAGVAGKRGEAQSATVEEQAITMTRVRARENEKSPGERGALTRTYTRTCTHMHAHTCTPHAYACACSCALPLRAAVARRLLRPPPRRDVGTRGAHPPAARDR